MKKILLALSIIIVGCSKTTQQVNNNYITVTLIDSSTVSRWVEISPTNYNYSGNTCNNNTKYSSFSYNDSFGNLKLYQSKSLEQWKFEVYRNDTLIDTQLRLNQGIYYYSVKNGDKILFICKNLL